MASQIIIKAGDTEPLELTVDATGLTNLADVSSAVLYARENKASANHVDAGACTVSDSATKELTFDPVGKKVGGGNAFDAAGIYQCYVKISWTDGDVTRHPGADFIVVIARGSLE